MYADYSFYTGTYRGVEISERDWPAVSREASAYIDVITYGRIKKGASITDDVRMAVCAVAEVVHKHNVTTSRVTGLKSENVDGYSVAYEDSAAIDQQCSADKLNAAGLYLPLTDPLRYAGVV